VAGARGHAGKAWREAVFQATERFTLVPLGRPVLERAAQSFPTLLGTLDAIQLASALVVRDRFEDLSLATHDQELAIAARAVGFEVQGIPRRA
jgi:hypothetical protein